MLVLHPNSRCDVCLESYHTKEPVAINCGHIFCRSCVYSLPRQNCPLCRLPFRTEETRRIHADRSLVPPSTPAFTSTELDGITTHARSLQSDITRVVLDGASVSDVADLLGELSNWLTSQPREEHRDLRAAHTLLWRYTNLQGKIDIEKRRVVDVEQNCSVLKAQLAEEQARFDALLHEERDRFQTQLEEERAIASAKYDELEQKSFDEREVLLRVEQELKEEKERLEKECDEWRTKCEDVTTECRRLSEELEKVKRNPLLPSRPGEPRFFYLHEQNGAKPEPVTLFKDDGWDSGSALKVQIEGKDKDNVFYLSPVPATQPIPELPSSISAFLPANDELDDPIDDDRSHAGSNGVSTMSSASRSIPIKTRSPSHRDRTRSNSSLLSRPDPDAMSISVPRSSLDVHMTSPSGSPNGSQYGPRLPPPDYSSSSLGRMQENSLGLRSDDTRSSPPAYDEHEERRRMRQQLQSILQDPQKPSRKSSLSHGSERERDRERERTRPAVSSAMSSTRTPSPVSSTSQSYTKSMLDERYRQHHLQVPTSAPLSSASSAAAERERARASSVNSQNAPTPSPSVPPHHSMPPTTSSSSLSHVTAVRDREATPVHPMYSAAPSPMPMPMNPQSQSRPPHTRRQSVDTNPAMSNLSGSISKGKASSMHMSQAAPGYASGLTRSLREAPRVS